MKHTHDLLDKPLMLPTIQYRRMVCQLTVWICITIGSVAADEQTTLTPKTVRDTAEAAQADSHGDKQKLLENFVAKLPGQQHDALLQKRRNAILSRTKSKGSIYQNPRFFELCPGLIADSASERRIWGGKKAQPGEFNACVAVGDDKDYFCSGTLIAKRIVVTAGHCTATAVGDSDPTRVCIGSSVGKPQSVFRVRQNGVFRHKDYREDPGPHNDIALLILDKDVDDVDPAPIASSNVCEAMRTVRIVGFGTTDKAGSSGFGTKRMADVIVISPDGIRFGGAEYGADPEFEFVAEDLHADTCRGDSGGPAFVADTHGHWLLAGATSRATKKSEDSDVPCGDGGIYVRVDKYLSWIRDIAANNGVRFPK